MFPTNFNLQALPLSFYSTLQRVEGIHSSPIKDVFFKHFRHLSVPTWKVSQLSIQDSSKRSTVVMEIMEGPLKENQFVTFIL